jgi:hypothetical protein
MEAYETRVISMRLGLRSASPNFRSAIAEEYAALQPKTPLLLPSPGGKMPRPNPDSRRSHHPRLAASTPQRPRPPLPKYTAVDVFMNDILRHSVPAQPPAYAHSVGGRRE